MIAVVGLRTKLHPVLVKCPRCIDDALTVLRFAHGFLLGFVSRYLELVLKVHYRRRGMRPHQRASIFVRITTPKSQLCICEPDRPPPLFGADQVHVPKLSPERIGTTMFKHPRKNKVRKDIQS
jgi:hypothetical protein